MPNQPKTPLQNVRVERDLWLAFGAVAEPDRSAVLREFIRWYVGEPGVKAPRRPGVNRTVSADHGGPPTDSGA
jgi:hypothetical protein